MTQVWPLKFRPVDTSSLLFADDAGGFFRADNEFLERYASDALSASDLVFLSKNGHSYSTEYDLPFTSFAYRWTRRQSIRKTLSYVILVPTLRCNLTCTYCQVSRAPETARGFDWSDETLAETITYLDGLTTAEIKIEFQGGEPLLRLDLLEKIRTFCRSRFTRSQFVVCTNLQRLGPDEWAFLDADDTFVSTSLDGDFATHQRQRTNDNDKTETFFANLEEAIHRLGSKKVSALPTIDVDNPPNIETLLDNFARFGLRSVYLRPINHHGFARKMKPKGDVTARWNIFHAQFIETLIERNARTGNFMEEYYFSQCLKRVLRSDADNHVDLRNPNFFASDYIVVDHDGVFYPTDEARMLSRIGRVDLSVGRVATGIDQKKVAMLNGSSLNNFDPDCIHCAYQPFCGSDVVDDISRYGRVDIPRHETWFCRRQTSIFDKVFELIYRDDPATQKSLAHWIGLPAWPQELVMVHR
jgi:His-Xaa-Ser system radical SAM maturase HxsB